MAESPDGRGVLLFGGRLNNQFRNIYENRIFELRVGANNWTILDITLQKGRFQHSVIRYKTAKLNI